MGTKRLDTRVFRDRLPPRKRELSAFDDGKLPWSLFQDDRSCGNPAVVLNLAVTLVTATTWRSSSVG